MHHVYIIYSASRDQYYKGYTGLSPELRLERHNEGWTRSTKSGIPWKLVFIKSFGSKSEALKFERFLKKQKNREFIERLLDSDQNELSW
jgi:putative endonuclease